MARMKLRFGSRSALIGSTPLTASAEELNAVATRAERVVPITATGNITQAANEGKLNTLSAAELVTLTLPAATGSGDKYKFVSILTNTSSYVIQKAGSDVMKGLVISLDNDAAAVTGYAANAAGDDVFTMNGTTTGGLPGDWVEFQDIAAGVWSVKGMVVVPAGSDPADPFS